VLFFNHISGKSLLQCTQVYILKSVKKIFSQAKVSYRHEQPKRGGGSLFGWTAKDLLEWSPLRARGEDGAFPAGSRSGRQHPRTPGDRLPIDSWSDFDA
jgi:hypothetical protein